MNTPESDLRREAIHFMEELNRKDAADLRHPIEHHIASDFFEYSPADGEPSGSEVFYELMSDLKRALPDLQVTLEDLDSDGGDLRGRVTLAGTKDGSLWGTPASGRPIRLGTDIAIRPRDDGLAVSFPSISLPQLIGVMRELDLVNPPDEMDQPPRYPSSLPDSLLGLLYNGGAAGRPCSHLDDIRVTEPATDVCEACVAQGDVWPALRMCLTCGYVGCCETSKNKHMKRHHEQTGHPLMRSIRLDEGWIWCYEDNAFFGKRILEKHR